MPIRIVLIDYGTDWGIGIQDRGARVGGCRTKVAGIGNLCTRSIVVRVMPIIKPRHVLA